MSSLKINKKAVIQYFLIYLCFLNTSSKVSSLYGDNFVLFILLMIAVCVFTRRVLLNKNYTFFLMILFGSIFVQHTLIQGNISIPSILNMAGKFLIAYCAVRVCKEAFVHRFLKLTVFLAGISLICFVLSYTPVASIMSSIFITNHASCWTGNISYGRFLYHYMPGYTRNVGIFNEPGVYQLFLNMALFVLLFMQETSGVTGKKRNRYLILILITIVTTMSTAGYLTTLFIFAGYTISMNQKLSIRNLSMILGGIIILAIFTQTDIFYDNFLGKIALSDSSVGFESGTGNARVASILLDLSYIKENIWGYGYSGTWVNTSSIATFEKGSSVGLTSLINVYGVPIAGIIYVSYIWSFLKISKTKIQFITLLLMFISSFLSQPWVVSPVYLWIIAYAFIDRKEKKGSKDEIYI